MAQESVVNIVSRLAAKFEVKAGVKPTVVYLGQSQMRAMRWEMGYISAPTKTLSNAMKNSAAGMRLEIVDSESHIGFGLQLFGETSD